MSDSLKLYLADDDQDDCLLFEEALTELSLAVTLTIFHDGESLLDAMSCDGKTGPDIVFLDMNMPRKNGLQCLEIIKASALFGDIPVVIFSTAVDESLARSVAKLGAAKFIRKPSNYSELKKTLQETLSAYTVGQADNS